MFSSLFSSQQGAGRTMETGASSTIIIDYSRARRMLSHTLACCAFVQLRCRYLLYALHANSICDVIRQQKLAVAEIPREAPCYLWPPYGIGQAIRPIFLPYGFFFFFLSSSFFLECAARGSLEMQDPKKSPKNRHLGTIAQLETRFSTPTRT